MKKKSQNKLINSFKFAFVGFLTTYKQERNMRIHTMFAIVAITMGFVFGISASEWKFIIFSIAMVFSAEIINTSIENLVDLVTLEQREKAKIAKDTSAAFVLVLSIAAAIIGLIVFVPYIIEWIGK